MKAKGHVIQFRSARSFATFLPAAFVLPTGGSFAQVFNVLAHIIHERFYCNRRYAAATCLAALVRSQAAGSPFTTSTYYFKYASVSQGFACPSPRRLGGLVTNRHE